MSSTATTICALCAQESGLTWLLCDGCRTPENLASLLDSYADPASTGYSVDGHSALIAFGSADVLQHLPVLSDRIVANPVLNGWWSYWYSWISSAPENAEFFTYLQGVLPGCPALASLVQPKEQKQPPIAGQIATTLLSISNGVVSQFTTEANQAVQGILKKGFAVVNLPSQRLSETAVIIFKKGPINSCVGLKRMQKKQSAVSLSTLERYWLN